MLTIDSLSDDLSSYLTPDQVQDVNKAYEFAASAHTGQQRKSGDPYIVHPLEVAQILSDMHMDHECLMAALMHDVIEDTGIPKHTISKEFGDEVANLVDGVSKLSSIFKTRAEAQAENFQKMTIAMARDIRVILIKLADRLHNMRTLGSLERERQIRIAKETLEIYAPIANRLGMHSLRVEFEELSFEVIYPLRSSMISKAVKKLRGNRTEVVQLISTSLKKRLEEEKIDSEVIGREKHLYSIYDKMRTQHKSFNEIMDVYAFRIIVDSPDNCYRTLGIVHNLYKPVAGRFKDYIAIPKANGYQSLHTTLFGSHGFPIEIQIRTREMEMVANHGIAGHWLYKARDESSGHHQRAREWMQELLQIQQSTGNSLEFIENVKVDLFPDEVYVFSPKGEIYVLNQGATPVDFAYAIHTDIGSTCVACRIDRRLAPLSATLDNGQTVEIITAPGALPNPDWLNFVVTGKARSGIRHALKNQQRSESISLGKRLLDRTLHSMNLSIDDIDPERIEEVVKERDFHSFVDLLADIGLGNQMSHVIVRKLMSQEESSAENFEHQGPLAIKGTEGMVISYAKCCKPIPGDPIIGHISAGRGIVIHTDNCKNMQDLREKPNEVMNVRWDPNVNQEFSVELRVELAQEKGVIAILATSVTNADANIEGISMVERDAQLSIVNMVIAVKNRVHLANVIKRIRTIRGISRVVRVRS